MTGPSVNESLWDLFFFARSDVGLYSQAITPLLNKLYDLRYHVLIRVVKAFPLMVLFLSHCCVRLCPLFFSTGPVRPWWLAGFLLRRAHLRRTNSFPAADTGHLSSSYVRAVECELAYINGWITEYSRLLEHSLNTILNYYILVCSMFLFFPVLTFVYFDWWM